TRLVIRGDHGVVTRLSTLRNREVLHEATVLVGLHRDRLTHRVALGVDQLNGRLSTRSETLTGHFGRLTRSNLRRVNLDRGVNRARTAVTLGDSQRSLSRLTRLIVGTDHSEVTRLSTLRNRKVNREPTIAVSLRRNRLTNRLTSRVHQLNTRRRIRRETLTSNRGRLTRSNLRRVNRDRGSTRLDDLDRRRVLVPLRVLGTDLVITRLSVLRDRELGLEGAVLTNRSGDRLTHRVALSI